VLPSVEADPSDRASAVVAVLAVCGAATGGGWVVCRLSLLTALPGF